MNLRICCFLVLVAASCCVPGLATDFVIQPGQGELPGLHERGHNDTIMPKHADLLAQARQVTIMPKQGDLLARDIQDRLRQDEGPVECQGRQTVTVGKEGLVITSLGYPDDYRNREKCVVKIKAEDPECTLVVECPDFHLQDPRNGKCKDFVQFKEKGLNGEKLCGNPEDGVEYESSTNTLKLKFKTNRRKTYPGFSCTAYCVCPSTTTATTTTTPDTTTTTTTTPSPTTTTSTTTTTTTTTSADQCECGIANSNRIVGGVPTDSNEYPWQVGLKLNGGSSYWCGGSIIDERYIVTAAHCVNGLSTQQAQSLVVGVGDHNMASTSDDQPGTSTVAVQSITIHPQYNPNTLNNDIAILELTEPLDLSLQEIGRVCLPTDASETYAGMTATATGWGTLSSGGTQPDVLQEVDVLILDPSCPGRPQPYIISSNMLCAGFAEGGKDTCQGDSGGPLVLQNNSPYYELVGITSWGFGCADRNSPGVYTRVASYVDWIKENTPNSDCLQ